MFLAAALSSFFPHNPRQALAAVREAGLGRVELSLAPPRHDLADPLLPDSHSVPAWEEALAAVSLEVAALHLPPYDLADDRHLAAACRALQLAPRFRASLAVTCAGDDQGNDVRRARLLDGLRRLADHAAELGLILALDTLPGLCGDARQMLRTLDELGCPAVRLCFDTGNYQLAQPQASVEVALQRVCGALAAVRLKDTSGASTKAGFPPLGQGADLDFARLHQILKATGFGGPAVIAFQSARRRALALDECRQWLAQSVLHLRHCGWSV